MWLPINHIVQTFHLMLNPPKAHHLFQLEVCLQIALPIIVSDYQYTKIILETYSSR